MIDMLTFTLVLVGGIAAATLLLAAAVGIYETTVDDDSYDL